MIQDLFVKAIEVTNSTRLHYGLSGDILHMFNDVEVMTKKEITALLE